MQDGWRINLGIRSEPFKKSVLFRDWGDLTEEDAPPGFDVLAKIISRHVMGESFPE